MATHGRVRQVYSGTESKAIATQKSAVTVVEALSDKFIK